MPVAALAVVAGAVLAGGGAQRVTGMGFALVSSPFLVLLLGPFEGVLLANLLNLVVNAVVALQTWRETEWRRAALLGVPALLALVPGAWVARHLPAPVLSVFVGTIVVLALLVVTFVRRARVVRGTVGAVAAGAAAGFLNVTAGIAGPAVALYALSSEWEHRRFVATMQIFFGVLNAASLIAKGGLPHVPGSVLVVALVALAVGTLVGQWLHDRVPSDRARLATTVVAVVGATLTVVKGLLAL
ncbi:MAG: sulfite exporter TauE/SafE family protein [Actinomycetales bacterium]